MKLESDSFAHMQRIPDQFAFGKGDPEQGIALSDNRNPQLSWSEIPDGCSSLVLLCIDTDVPSSAENVNKPDVAIPADLPRTNFYHWVMVDLPATDGSIAAGECSNGIAVRGKTEPPGPRGSRQGLSNYTDWFAGDPDMEGDYYGYDGPCPPFNDELLHHYHFILYATDMESCPVTGKFTGPEVELAIAGHVMAEARLTGTYSTNPEVR